MDRIVMALYADNTATAYQAWRQLFVIERHTHVNILDNRCVKPKIKIPDADRIYYGKQRSNS